MEVFFILPDDAGGVTYVYVTHIYMRGACLSTTRASLYKHESTFY